MPVRVTYIETLRVQRDLLDLPRGMDRFRAYLDKMTEGSGDVVLPIGEMNPMSREHVRDRLDQWLASGAEPFAKGVAEQAARDLHAIPNSVELKASLVVPDDVHGGWTDRDRVDFRNRFEDKGRVRRRFATTLLWVSEDAGESRFPVLVRRLRASIYRTAYQAVAGLPRDLPAMLRQEGLALKFSGWPTHTDAPRQKQARKAIAEAPPTKADFGATYAVLFGDEAGRRLGYEARGCPRYAAWDVAVQEAGDPVAQFPSGPLRL